MSAAEEARTLRSSATESATYDAFVSYSRAADGRLAPALQQGLQSFAKPWYRRRALRVFRDKSSLSASPQLWSSIEEAMRGSRFLVLLASPEAAASRWVDQEVGWWRKYRSRETLLIGLTDGHLAWDESISDFEYEATDAVPASLREWFESEPLWVDLRWARTEQDLSPRNPQFQDRLAELAAPIRDVSKDDLIGQDVTEHRRAVRLARTAIALLTVLLIAAGVSTAVAVTLNAPNRLIVALGVVICWLVVLI